MSLPSFIPVNRFTERRALVSTAVTYRGMSLAYSRRDWGDPVPLQTNPIAASFNVIVPIADMPRHGGWLDGRRTDLPFHPRGAIGSFNWRQGWTADLRQPFEALSLYVPQAALDELTEEFAGAPISYLTCDVFCEGKADPHVLGLAESMLALIRYPHQANALFADHLFGAFRLHLAVAYGGLCVPERRTRTGLAPWQQRRATEMMMDDLSADIAVDEIAATCGLSSRQFERAFQQSTGAPPHRWRLLRRARRAGELAETGDLPLAEIALLCGFADQSHMTRVFRRLLGTTPSAYRRMRRGERANSRRDAIIPT